MSDTCRCSCKPTTDTPKQYVVGIRHSELTPEWQLTYHARTRISPLDILRDIRTAFNTRGIHVEKDALWDAATQIHREWVKSPLQVTAPFTTTITIPDTRKGTEK